MWVCEICLRGLLNASKTCDESKQWRRSKMRKREKFGEQNGPRRGAEYMCFKDCL